VRSVRPLLAVGNGKLGESIHHFDLPVNAVCCPARTSVCQRVCYAQLWRFRTSIVRKRLAWNYRQAMKPDFAARMIAEIQRKGVLVIRLHVSGDFLSAEYALKWLEVMRACPKTRYYFYTRCWRLPPIARVLEQMAELDCCRVWYSLDLETGLPEVLPPKVRLAYLQTNEQVEEADLVFRIQKLRRLPSLSLAMVCPHETQTGKEQQTNCGNCQHCWQ
jgi:hypothetical protein